MTTEPLLSATGPLGLTMGDAAGIGPELVARLFSQGLPASTVVYGDAGAVSRAVAQLGLSLPVTAHDSVAQWKAAHQNMAISSEIPVIRCADPLPQDLPLGQVSAQAGLASYHFLLAAIADAMAGEISAIVTAPINKRSLKAGGVDFPGHTEILAQEAGVPRVAMMLLNEQLRVILVTIHVALSEVPALITFENELDTIRLADRACRMVGLASPRIAVAGLNPHAGEGGRFGHEDETIIRPAIDAARAEGLDVDGPFPGDTIFMRARRGEFDIVVAQYHDQGLIPVKYLGVDNGVNVTVGLPFIRTSVDHGTAYDIAGKGVADPASLRVACELALRMHNPGV
ncbi:4-hydroxythreonine-4-phosphate dehydrogenase PdxA [Advenella mimigardefordensis]|uniref:4-hydroxythreonine-4-phosphate dehydrogenase n=1 Tax=Advenella mimigardefordensis (strain DSM 17166 / LMG 22922 / DPN7) TaxID=1247726 RepID=W0PD12_ADVMD|nr:4-hydroxythreonine-4-phosphate dehydrogenase PdxA [Advenella mimigardefordensis]AHG64754.1 4-hydroxythreonine-4-phosphate dehydrogenase [Advenella mimigardefordensis DPN7]